MAAFFYLTRAELRLAWAETYGSFTALMFYCLAPLTFSLSVGPQILPEVAGGVLWTCVLLTGLLSLEGLFQADYEDGTLEGYWSSAVSLEAVFLSKCLKHWCTTAIPLLVLTPFLGLILPLSDLAAMMKTLVLGTPSLSLLGTFGASLTLGARYGGLLLVVLLLPLLVPIVIFSLGALDAAMNARTISPHISLLAAYLCFTFPLTVFLGPACLRQALRCA